MIDQFFQYFEIKDITILNKDDGSPENTNIYLVLSKM